MGTADPIAQDTINKVLDLAQDVKCINVSPNRHNLRFFCVEGLKAPTVKGARLAYYPVEK